ncbi:MAG: hypothetical protein AB7V13_20395 [Pseudorhodoplanes sp.]|uniref:hypothetical protein n=1 Tax=Pseudorhodoplanes sp. TaxID=1934341 RepID=UPI003D13DBF1
MKACFAIASHFSVKGSWSDRLLVAGAEGWRPPREDELTELTSPSGDDTAGFRLFSVPTHMRHRFWAMLNDEATEGSGDFEYFSDDLAEFLGFKGLTPPKDSVCELLVQDAGGTVSTGDVWALINFGEEPVLLAWPELRLRLSPGDGFRMAPESPPDVLPPATDELNVLVAIRTGAA